MESIVSPWFVYLLSVVDAVVLVATILAVIGIGGVVILAIEGGVNYECRDFVCTGQENLERSKKNFSVCRKLLLPTIIVSIVAIFTPSKNTLIGMYVADHLTYDTAGKIIEGGGKLKEELKADVLELIEAIKDEGGE